MKAVIMKKQNLNLELRLSNALFSLLNNKNYEQIKISDITRVAKVARTTFYLCFNNKNELLRFSWNRYMIPFVAGLHNFFTLDQKENIAKTTIALEEISKQIKYVPVLLNIKTASFDPRKEIENNVKHEIKNILILKGQKVNKTILDYFSSLYFVNLLETQKWWAKHPDIKPEKIAELIYRCCYQGLISLLKT